MDINDKHTCYGRQNEACVFRTWRKEHTVMDTVLNIKEYKLMLSGEILNVIVVGCSLINKYIF